MKKLVLIGPDGTKTYIDLGEDFSFNAEDMKKYMYIMFEHLSEDNLEVLFFDEKSNVGRQIVVPNVERFMEMLAYKEMTRDMITDGDIEFFFANEEKIVLN